MAALCSTETTKDRRNCKSASGKSFDSTGWGELLCHRKNASARKRLKGPGYSFKIAVLKNLLSLSRPIRSAGGILEDRNILSNAAMSMSVEGCANSKCVGLGDKPLKSPCQTKCLSMPGSAISSWTKGSFQMAGAPGASGSRGCSSTNQRPLSHMMSKKVKQKVSSRLPTSTCFSSLMLRLCIPQRLLSVRSGLGSFSPFNM